MASTRAQSGIEPINIEMMSNSGVPQVESKILESLNYLVWEKSNEMPK